MNSMCLILLGTEKEQSSLMLKSADNAFREMPPQGKRYHIHRCRSSAVYRTIQLLEPTITDHDFLPRFSAI